MDGEEITQLMDGFWQIESYDVPMLSSRYIQKIRKFDRQYGEPEQTFSPAWHEEQNRQGPDTSCPALITAATSSERSRVVRVILGNVEDPSTGDVRIMQYQTTEERDADPLRIRNQTENLEAESHKL